MCLHRQAGATGFSPRDRDLVARIAPHVAEGLRRALLTGQARESYPALGHGVVILDASGSVTAVNDAAERWLAQIPESDWPSSCQLPLPLLAAAGHAEMAPEHPAPAVRLRTVRGDWLSVHASPLHGSGERSTVLVLEEPGPGEPASLILASHGVTGALWPGWSRWCWGGIFHQAGRRPAGHQPVHRPGTPAGGLRQTRRPQPPGTGRRPVGPRPRAGRGEPRRAIVRPARPCSAIIGEQGLL